MVVLDDDPTGVQMLAGVDVALDWSAETMGELLGSDARALHILTNSRVLSPAAARATVGAAASAAVAADPLVRPILRGDSTLRAHMFEEYEALRDVVFPASNPPLLLVPALPSAGRVTVDGVHKIERNGVRLPLHETEYAHDGVFSYSSSRLLSWAEERSHGWFAADAGEEITLEMLRRSGGGAVMDALVGLTERGRPAACVPDAETIEDLELIAAGLRAATLRGAQVVVRCGPAFAGVASATIADRLVRPPPAPEGLLVVCGSYVATTRQQLGQVQAEWPDVTVEADVSTLVASDPEPEIRRLAAEAAGRLRSNRLAVITTPAVDATSVDLELGERIASNLSSIIRHIDHPPSVVLGKGGATSAIVAKIGLDATRATVVGPIATGVSLWEVNSRPYIVFPGNVGDGGLLLEVIKSTLRS